MKATLEFDFDKEDSDDRMNLEDALNGTKWKLLVWEHDQYLRGKTKYASDETSEETIDALQSARDNLWDLIRSSGLNLD